MDKLHINSLLGVHLFVLRCTRHGATMSRPLTLGSDSDYAVRQSEEVCRWFAEFNV
jgi:hypothetical protein